MNSFPKASKIPPCPGGRFAFGVWGRLAENPWMTSVREAAPGISPDRRTEPRFRLRRAEHRRAPRPCAIQNRLPRQNCPSFFALLSEGTSGPKDGSAWFDRTLTLSCGKAKGRHRSTVARVLTGGALALPLQAWQGGAGQNFFKGEKRGTKYGVFRADVSSGIVQPER